MHQSIPAVPTPLGNSRAFAYVFIPGVENLKFYYFPEEIIKYSLQKKKTFRPIKGIFSQTWILRERGKQIELRGIVLACFCHQYSYFIHEKFRA